MHGGVMNDLRLLTMTTVMLSRCARYGTVNRPLMVARW